MHSTRVTPVSDVLTGLLGGPWKGKSGPERADANTLEQAQMVTN